MELFGFPAVRWEDVRRILLGARRDDRLPTLGGDNGFATGVNKHGQVVGWAETKMHDPTCDAPQQVLQFKAVMWEPKKGTKLVLKPLKGDSASAATAINDRGQAVGISGECCRSLQRAARGDLNEVGDVVGFSKSARRPEW